MSSEGDSGRDQARMAIKEMSKQDIDAYVQTSSFNQDVQQVMLFPSEASLIMVDVHNHDEMILID